MAKITFIDVDLASDVEAIIKHELESIDSHTKEIIQREADSVTTPKILAAKSREAKLEQLYGMLVDAHHTNNAVTMDVMVEVCKPEIANAISLVQHLKKFIATNKQNEYVLKKVTAGGKPAYKLLPYNITLS